MHVGRKVQYRETAVGVVVSQAMNGTGGLSCLKNGNCFGSTGKQSIAFSWGT